MWTRNKIATIVGLFPPAIFTLAMLVTLASLGGCSPVEKQAYQAVVSANAFLKTVANAHPECASGDSTLCTALKRAFSAKNALIDAVEVYCAGPDFSGGGKCNPPAKGTPAFAQAEAKLRAAMAGYAQIEKDLKGVNYK